VSLEVICTTITGYISGQLVLEAKVRHDSSPPGATEPVMSVGDSEARPNRLRISSA
jgi:hypothetical protein